MANVSVICFLASYLVAFVLELTRLLRRSSINRIVMISFTAAGFVAHTAYLLVRSGRTGMEPLLSSSHDWMLVLAWVAILLYLFLTTVDRQLAVGIFLLPLVLLLIATAYFVNAETSPLIGQDAAHRTAMHNWAMLHASLLVFGMAGVLVGIVLSLMYLVQHRRLKHKQGPKEGLRLPSLAQLARWNWWSVVFSVPLLTLGMATGVLLALLSQAGPQPVTFVDPLIVSYGIVWTIMFAFFVWICAYRARNPAGKQVAWLTVWAFGFLLVTLLGLQVLTGNSLQTWHAHLAGPFSSQLV